MRLFNAEGTISVAEAQGKRQKTKDVSAENKKKEICLNCQRHECRGNCKRVSKP